MDLIHPVFLLDIQNAKKISLKTKGSLENISNCFGLFGIADKVKKDLFVDVRDVKNQTVQLDLKEKDNCLWINVHMLTKDMVRTLLESSKIRKWLKADVTKDSSTSSVLWKKDKKTFDSSKPLNPLFTGELEFEDSSNNMINEQASNSQLTKDTQTKSIFEWTHILSLLPKLVHKQRLQSFELSFAVKCLIRGVRAQFAEKVSSVESILDPEGEEFYKAFDLFGEQYETLEKICITWDVNEQEMIKLIGRLPYEYIPLTQSKLRQQIPPQIQYKAFRNTLFDPQNNGVSAASLDHLIFLPWSKELRSIDHPYHEDFVALHLSILLGTSIIWFPQWKQNVQEEVKTRGGKLEYSIASSSTSLQKVEVPQLAFSLSIFQALLSKPFMDPDIVIRNEWSLWNNQVPIQFIGILRSVQSTSRPTFRLITFAGLDEKEEANFDATFLDEKSNDVDLHGELHKKVKLWYWKIRTTQSHSQFAISAAQKVAIGQDAKIELQYCLPLRGKSSLFLPLLGLPYNIKFASAINLFLYGKDQLENKQKITSYLSHFDLLIKNPCLRFLFPLCIHRVSKNVTRLASLVKQIRLYAMLHSWKETQNTLMDPFDQTNVVDHLTEEVDYIPEETDQNGFWFLNPFGRQKKFNEQGFEQLDEKTLTQLKRYDHLLNSIYLIRAQFINHKRRQKYWRNNYRMTWVGLRDFLMTIPLPSKAEMEEQAVMSGTTLRQQEEKYTLWQKFVNACKDCARNSVSGLAKITEIIKKILPEKYRRLLLTPFTLYLFSFFVLGYCFNIWFALQFLAGVKAGTCSASYMARIVAFLAGRYDMMEDFLKDDSNEEQIPGVINIDNELEQQEMQTYLQEMQRNLNQEFHKVIDRFMMHAKSFVNVTKTKGSREWSYDFLNDDIHVTGLEMLLGEDPFRSYEKSKDILEQLSQKTPTTTFETIGPNWQMNKNWTSISNFEKYGYSCALSSISTPVILLYHYLRQKQEDSSPLQITLRASETSCIALLQTLETITQLFHGTHWIGKEEIEAEFVSSYKKLGNKLELQVWFVNPTAEFQIPKDPNFFKQFDAVWGNRLSIRVLVEKIPPKPLSTLQESETESSQFNKHLYDIFPDYWKCKKTAGKENTPHLFLYLLDPVDNDDGYRCFLYNPTVEDKELSKDESYFLKFPPKILEELQSVDKEFITSSLMSQISCKVQGAICYVGRTAINWTFSLIGLLWKLLAKIRGMMTIPAISSLLVSSSLIDLQSIFKNIQVHILNRMTAPSDQGYFEGIWNSPGMQNLFLNFDLSTLSSLLIFGTSLVMLVVAVYFLRKHGPTVIKWFLSLFSFRPKKEQSEVRSDEFTMFGTFKTMVNLLLDPRSNYIQQFYPPVNQLTGSTGFYEYHTSWFPEKKSSSLVISVLPKSGATFQELRKQITAFANRNHLPGLTWEDMKTTKVSLIQAMDQLILDPEKQKGHSLYYRMGEWIREWKTNVARDPTYWEKIKSWFCNPQSQEAKALHFVTDDDHASSNFGGNYSTKISDSFKELHIVSCDPIQASNTQSNLDFLMQGNRSDHTILPDMNLSLPVARDYVLLCYAVALRYLIPDHLIHAWNERFIVAEKMNLPITKVYVRTGLLQEQSDVRDIGHKDPTEQVPIAQGLVELFRYGLLSPYLTICCDEIRKRAHPPLFQFHAIHHNQYPPNLLVDPIVQSRFATGDSKLALSILESNVQTSVYTFHQNEQDPPEDIRYQVFQISDYGVRFRPEATSSEDIYFTMQAELVRDERTNFLNDFEALSSFYTPYSSERERYLDAPKKLKKQKIR